MIEIGSKWIYRGDKKKIGEVVFIGPDGKHVIHAAGEGGTFVYNNDVYEFGDPDGGWKPYKEPFTITKYALIRRHKINLAISFSSALFDSEEKAKEYYSFNNHFEVIKIIPITYVEGE